MTSGSRLEIVGSPSSVGGFHGIWAYSGVFQALCLRVCLFSGPPCSEVNDAQVDSWRDCFMMSWLDDDLFPRGMMRRTD
jgi:hypothetical protein